MSVSMPSHRQPSLIDGVQRQVVHVRLRPSAKGHREGQQEAANSDRAIQGRRQRLLHSLMINAERGNAIDDSKRYRCFATQL